MTTNQTFECEDSSFEKSSALYDFLDENFKKASIAKHIRNALLQLTKNIKCDIKVSISKEETLFTEIHTVMFPGLMSLELKLNAYNETTHVSKKKSIRTPKTFLDLNQQKARLKRVFGPYIGTGLVELLDSVFSTTRTDFAFECEFFDMEEFYLLAEYSKDYIGIEINIQKL